MRTCRSLLTILLTAALACLPLMGSDGAMLTPIAGTVSVNGRTVASTTLNSGDAVLVSPDGTAKLTLNGASIMVMSRSRFGVSTDGKSLNLGFGGLQIAGSIPVLTLNHSIVPVSSDAQYTVTRVSDRAYVIATAGDVKIASGTRSYIVRSGEAATFQDQTQTTTTTTQDTTQDQNNDNRKGGAALPESTTTTTTQIPAAGATGGATVALPLAIGLAAAAAVVTGIIVHAVTVCSNCVVSPS
jgi:hypothetical protein